MGGPEPSRAALNVDLRAPDLDTPASDPLDPLFSTLQEKGNRMGRYGAVGKVPCR